MFYSYELLCLRKGGRFSAIWYAATHRKVFLAESSKVNIADSCAELIEGIKTNKMPGDGRKSPKFSLYLASMLMYGACLVHRQQVLTFLDYVMNQERIIHMHFAAELVSTMRTGKRRDADPGAAIEGSEADASSPKRRKIRKKKTVPKMEPQIVSKLPEASEVVLEVPKPAPQQDNIEIEMDLALMEGPQLIKPATEMPEYISANIPTEDKINQPENEMVCDVERNITTLARTDSLEPQAVSEKIVLKQIEVETTGAQLPGPEEMGAQLPEAEQLLIEQAGLQVQPVSEQKGPEPTEPPLTAPPVPEQMELIQAVSEGRPEQPTVTAAPPAAAEQETEDHKLNPQKVKKLCIVDAVIRLDNEELLKFRCSSRFTFPREEFMERDVADPEVAPLYQKIVKILWHDQNTLRPTKRDETAEKSCEALRLEGSTGPSTPHMSLGFTPDKRATSVTGGASTMLAIAEQEDEESVSPRDLVGSGPDWRVCSYKSLVRSNLWKPVLFVCSTKGEPCVRADVDVQLNPGLGPLPAPEPQLLEPEPLAQPQPVPLPELELLPEMEPLTTAQQLADTTPLPQPLAQEQPEAQPWCSPLQAQLLPLSPSGWREQVLQTVQRQCAASKDGTVLFGTLRPPGTPRPAAAHTFSLLLEFVQWRLLTLTQEKPYGDIVIRAKPNRPEENIYLSD